MTTILEDETISSKDVVYSDQTVLSEGGIGGGGVDYMVGGSGYSATSGGYYVESAAPAFTEYVDAGSKYVTSDYVGNGDTYVYSDAVGLKGGRTSRLTKKLVVDDVVDVGLGDSYVESSSFGGASTLYDVSRELHQIRSEFAHAQGFSTEANARITRLAEKLHELKAYYSNQVSQVRMEYEGKVRAAQRSAEEVRLSMTTQLEMAEARADAAEREVTNLQNELQEARSRLRQLEITQQSQSSMTQQSEMQHRMQIENLQNELMRAKQECQRTITEFRSKSEATRPDNSRHYVPPPPPRIQTRTEIKVIESPVSEKLIIEKEALERQLDKLNEVHITDLEALELKNQRTITELIAFREENRKLRTELTTLKGEKERLTFQVNAFQAREKEVVERFEQKAREFINKKPEVRIEERIKYVEVPAPAPVQQQMPMPMQLVPMNFGYHTNIVREREQTVDMGELTHLRSQLTRLKDDYRVLEGKYEQALVTARTAQQSSSQNFSSTSFLQTAAPSTQQTGVDERIVRELQEKLFAAERARLQVVTEWQQKLTAREQELMGKQSQLEMQIMTIKGEKEREVQTRDLKIVSIQNEVTQVKSELEGRLDRLTHDKDSLVKDFEGKLARLREEVARSERELDKARGEAREYRTKLEIASSKSSSLESRMQMMVSERATIVQEQRAAGVPITESSSSILDSEVRVQEKQRLYEREKREKEDLLVEIQDLQRKLRQARTEANDAIERSSKSEVREKIVERVVDRPQQVVQQQQQPRVLVRRAMTPAPVRVQRDESVMYEYRQRIAGLQRQVNSQRQLIEDWEYKYMRAQDTIAELTMRARNTQIRVVERRVKVPVHMPIKVEPEVIVQRQAESTNLTNTSVELELRTQLQAKTVEAERLHLIVAELEVRLKRSQIVIQQLFAIIERTRQNTIKFSQGVMQLQMQHLSYEGGAEMQLLQTDRSLEDIIRLGQEAQDQALTSIRTISAPVLVKSDFLIVSEPSSFDSALVESEQRLKTVQAGAAFAAPTLVGGYKVSDGSNMTV